MSQSTQIALSLLRKNLGMSYLRYNKVCAVTLRSVHKNKKVQDRDELLYEYKSYDAKGLTLETGTSF